MNTFDVKLQNIPLLNLRMEFNSNYLYVRSPHFEEWSKSKDTPPETQLFVWYGLPDDFITFLVQRSVLGLEAYVPGAVFTEVGLRGRVTKKVLNATKNPFALKGKGTVDNCYNLLPSLIDPRFSLKASDTDLWKRQLQFYEHIRNPIFHGHQFMEWNSDIIRGIFDHLAKIYLWVDSWHNPDNLWPGASVFSTNIRSLLNGTSDK
jgi:hypothetical protein